MFVAGERVRTRDGIGTIEDAYPGTFATAGVPTYYVQLDQSYLTYAVEDVARPRSPVPVDHVMVFEHEISAA